MKMGAVCSFLSASREAFQRYSREGLFELGDRPRTGRPGSPLHVGLHLPGGDSIMMDCNSHAVIVVLDLTADPVRTGRYDETPPETGKSIDGGSLHGLQSRASSSAVASGPPPEAQTAMRGSPGIWRAPPLPRNWTTDS